MYIPAPHSIYENVFKLEPCSILEYDISSRKISKDFYWSLFEYCSAKNSMSEEESLSLLKDLDR